MQRMGLRDDESRENLEVAGNGGRCRFARRQVRHVGLQSSWGAQYRSPYLRERLFTYLFQHNHQYNIGG